MRPKSPVTTIAPVVTSNNGAKEASIALARKIFNEAKIPDTEKFINMISTCENSTWDPKRVNVNKDGTKDLGISQINDYWHKKKFESMFGKWEENIIIPEKNIRYALYLRQSWGSYKAWTCGKNI